LARRWARPYGEGVYLNLRPRSRALNTTISLKPDERKTLLDHLRRHPDPQLRLRAHIILLLAEGHTWALICAVLFCSSSTVDRWKARFEQGGVEALLGKPRGVPFFGARWPALVAGWVTSCAPRAFGFLRSRWNCALLALLLEREHHISVSRETVRRWLHQEGVAWRRPRPVLKRQDPRKAEILQGLRELLLNLPDDETVVWEDEVDLNLNPKIGCMWMPKGAQAEVVTPGDNDKRYLAGSLHWRTGKLIVTEGPKRDGALFTRHLDDLRHKLRRYRKIHLILDNAKFHYQSQPLYEFLGEHGDRFVFHFLPKYAPELNPIERVWWVLHEQITRNHQCRSIEELVELAFAWLADRKRFRVEDEAYHQPTPLTQAA
jgi:putative transposase